MGDKGFESSGLESYLQCAKQEEELLFWMIFDFSSEKQNLI